MVRRQVLVFVKCVATSCRLGHALQFLFTRIDDDDAGAILLGREDEPDPTHDPPDAMVC